MRRILAVISAGLILGVASPAQALDTLIDARFESVRLTRNGSIQVVLEYGCPGGQGYQGVPGESWFYVYQQGARDASYDSSFGETIVCEGNMQTIVRRFPPLEGEPWDPKLLPIVEMNLVVRASSDPERTLQAMEIDTFSLHGLEEATRRGDIHINRVRMNDRGALVVTMTYRCPKGWFVDVEDDSDWATLTARQDGPGWDDVEAWLPLGDAILCDGTPTTLVKRIEGLRQAGLSPALPTQLEAMMITVKSRTDHLQVYALDGIAMFIP